MKKLFIMTVIIFAVSALATPGFSGDKVTGKLSDIKLTINKADSKEELINVTKVNNKMRLGDTIKINNAEAEKSTNGYLLKDIELFYNNAPNETISIHVTEVGKIKIGDEIKIQNGKAKKKGGKEAVKIPTSL